MLHLKLLIFCRHTARFKILMILEILNFHPCIIDWAWFESIVAQLVECQTCYQVAGDRGTVFTVVILLQQFGVPHPLWCYSKIKADKNENFRICLLLACIVNLYVVLPKRR